MTDQDKKELEVAEKKAIQDSDGEPTREDVVYVPNVDIIEDPQAITVRADMPGASKDDVDIDVREGVLTLTASVQYPPDSWQPMQLRRSPGMTWKSEPCVISILPSLSST